ncbi:MAG: hypothetical protein ACRDQC_00875 [Gaiellales bacterium]
MNAAITAYPELVLGLLAGLLAARSGWRLAPVVAAGSVLAVLLVAGDAGFTNPCDGHGECTMPTTVDWTFVALANAGAWAFGVATGAATVWARRSAS